jgi:DNA topoisomerase I
MPGLTAKVFRTYNASYTFQEELKKTPKDGTIAEKILAYNRANREVAVLCNHQRAVPKTHGQQMEKMGDKILSIKYQRKLIKEQMMELEPSLKKKREWMDPESDLDDEFIHRHVQELELKEKEQAEKRLLKENEKRKAKGEKELRELPESKKKQYTMEQLEKKWESLSERIRTAKLALVDKVRYHNG